MLGIALLGGCSLALVQQHRLEHRFERHDLVEHTEEVGGATMHWWSGGEGPPLVLIHGFGGDAVFGWAEQAELAETHTLIVPDLAWFGASQGPPGDFSVDMQIGAIVAIMDREGVQQADLVGISYGGFVAGGLASLYPERVRKLVLVDSPGPALDQAGVDALLQRFGATKAEDVFVPTGPEGVRTLIELAWVDPPNTPKWLLKDVYKNLFVVAADEKRGLLRALQADRDAMTALWGPTAPTLVVWGAEDPVFPRDVGQKLADSLGGRFYVIEGTAHAPNLEKADEFNRVVEDFLRE